MTPRPPYQNYLHIQFIMTKISATFFTFNMISDGNYISSALLIDSSILKKVFSQLTIKEMVLFVCVWDQCSYSRVGILIIPNITLATHLEPRHTWNLLPKYLLLIQNLKKCSNISGNIPFVLSASLSTSGSFNSRFRKF